MDLHPHIVTRLVLGGLLGALTVRPAMAETWTSTGFTINPMLKALFRSQGMAFNAQNTTLLYSWQAGLQVTDLNGQVLEAAYSAIPKELRAKGSDHIGDIDVYNGVLYAPIEDGENYLNPLIVLFDATTLEPTGPIYSLPYSLQTEGVGWVAVDAARGRAYTSEWDPTFAINVYDLQTMTFQNQVVLDTTLGRIQGAKVFNGQLYAATDDATQSVYKIDLETGYVQELFSLLDLPGIFPEDPLLETEGMVFYPRDDGSDMHIQLIRGVFPNPDDPSHPFRVVPTTCIYHFKLS